MTTNTLIPSAAVFVLLGVAKNKPSFPFTCGVYSTEPDAFDRLVELKKQDRHSGYLDIEYEIIEDRIVK